MPEELPADWRAWPRDPYELLGVERGADETEIKRAYMKLIRKYKPEHAPEEFRRIREAYDLCKDSSPRFLPEIESRPEPVRRPKPEAPIPNPEGASEPATPWVDRGRPVEALWTAAIEGRESEAYFGLVSLWDANPRGEEIPLRLYWLLKLSPELDGTRTSHHWLALALRASQLRGPALELYYREIESESLSTLVFGQYEELLSAPARHSDRLAFAHKRLEVAGKRGLFGVIWRDLIRLREPILEYDDAAWLALLTSAIYWASWGEHLELDQLLRDELAALPHLQLKHGEAFDRIEFFEVLARDARVARRSGLDGKTLDLIRAGWSDPAAPPLAQIEHIAHRILNDRDAELDLFDRLKNAAPRIVQGLIDIFVRELETRGDFRDPAIAPEIIRGLARRINGGSVNRYGDLRFDLLELCERECLDPLEFAEACADDPLEAFRHFAQRAHGDSALRILWLAHRVVNG